MEFPFERQAIKNEPIPKGLDYVDATICQKIGGHKMKKTKAMFATATIMALLAAVIFFVWKFGNGIGFAVIEGVFAVYGFASFASDFCHWLQMPDTEILHRSGRH